MQALNMAVSSEHRATGNRYKEKITIPGSNVAM
jgi:hypothetical protein